MADYSSQPSSPQPQEEGKTEYQLAMEKARSIVAKFNATPKINPSSLVGGPPAGEPQSPEASSSQRQPWEEADGTNGNGRAGGPSSPPLNHRYSPQPDSYVPQDSARRRSRSPSSHRNHSSDRRRSRSPYRRSRSPPHRSRAWSRSRSRSRSASRRDHGGYDSRPYPSSGGGGYAIDTTGGPGGPPPMGGHGDYRPPYSGGPGQGYNPAEFSAPEIKFQVPMRHIGFVIGRGGESLKRIEREYQVRVRASQDFAPEDTVRDITIYGNVPEDMERAKEAILNNVRGAEERLNFSAQYNGQGAGPGPDGVPPAGGADSADPNAFTLNFTLPTHKLGRVIGRGGERIRDLQNQTNTKIFIAPEHATDPETNERPATITGDEERVHEARSLIEEILSQEFAPRPSQGGPGGYNSHSGGGGGGYREVMTISQNYVGLIIGRRGDTIRALQQQAGCRIQLDQVSNPAPDSSREVVLEGQPDRVAHARELINEKIASSNNRGGRYGDQRSGGGSSYASDPYSQSGGYGDQKANSGGAQAYPGYYDPNYASYYYGAQAGGAAPGAAPPASGAPDTSNYTPEQYAGYYQQYAQMYPQYASYYQGYYPQGGDGSGASDPAGGKNGPSAGPGPDQQ
ncbi:hypothetical protein H4R33_002319 [Dimargaris cristalligena]|uniref:K Homology domain-containing protein n=1 Tax=Dimargaris cristalligena TaxID=215637 RepID=A0A4P9ZPW6_9FUNG|nr:hypothetical protein H4R33_002319 [Dimargaris cristalligena]RKP34652.1 hypothetical protein BJ085DRAFT_28855 [Dimargaris cristalligena]|eukprot:RKP34652.1 hypothetical protein BJ085DRAFT_28855 [Dimargaris cristalligena]